MTGALQNLSPLLQLLGVLGGFLATLVGGLVTLRLWQQETRNRVDDNTRGLKAIEERLHTDANAAQAREGRFDTRLGVLEVQVASHSVAAARHDERLNAIAGGVERIERILEHREVLR